MSDLNQAIRRFKEDLESGFYESRKDEYRRLFPEEFNQNESLNTTIIFDELFGVDEGE